jgi:ADP-heptose:LPS heptosyltransferase
MTQNLIPHECLKNPGRVLFITHLALGDFTYLQTYLRAFAQEYPHVAIDIWVDEIRRTRCFWRWNSLKNYALYQWLDTCPFISRVYNQTYSFSRYKKSIQEAQEQHYSLVISLCTLRSDRYARMARIISPSGFIVGITHDYKYYNIIKHWRYKKLDAHIPYNYARDCVGRHITDVYAHWFTLLCGLTISPEHRRPVILIPREWITYAKLKFMKWGIDKRNNEFSRVVFINPFAKDKKRSWTLTAVKDLLMALKRDDEWGDVSVIINVEPRYYTQVKRYFDRHSIRNLYVITAKHHFFQLPALVSLCDLVISVETSVMHFASALGIPVIALMRRKSPEWVPWDQENSYVIWALRRHDWVRHISWSRVLEAVQAFQPRSCTRTTEPVGVFSTVKCTKNESLNSCR